MKYLIYISLLVTVPITGICLNNNNQYLGFWESSDGYRRIEITQERKKIKVRKKYDRKWRKYKREEYGIYEDCDGNLIKFLSPDIIEWCSRNGYQRIRYYKVHVSRRHGTYDDYHYRDRTNISGWWQSNNYNHQVQIVMTTDGLKARRDNRDRWHYYTRDPRNRSAYVDRNGSRYIVEGRNRMAWIRYDRQTSLTFYKD